MNSFQALRSSSIPLTVHFKPKGLPLVSGRLLFTPFSLIILFKVCRFLQHPIPVMGMPSKPLIRLIFCRGFFPKPLKVLLCHKAVVLVLVHPGYSISPVPTISGEPSPICPLGRCPMGDQQLLIYSLLKILQGNNKYICCETNMKLGGAKLQRILL